MLIENLHEICLCIFLPFDFISNGNEYVGLEFQCQSFPGGKA